MTLAWSEPTYMGGFESVKYTVITTEKVTSAEISRISDLNTTFAVVEGLELSSTYIFEVIATNIWTSGDPSEQFELLFLAPPSSPPNFYEDIESRTESSVKLVWDKTLDLGGSETVSYNVYLTDMA